MVTEKEIKKFIKDEVGKVKTFEVEVKKNVLTAILAAFAFVMALVWRDAIRAIIDHIMTGIAVDGAGYGYEIYSALMVTLVSVVGIMLVSKLKGKQDIKG